VENSEGVAFAAPTGTLLWCRPSPWLMPGCPSEGLCVACVAAGAWRDPRLLPAHMNIDSFFLSGYGGQISVISTSRGAS